MSSIVRPVAALFVTLAFSAFASAERIDLKPKFAPGPAQRLEVLLESEQKIEGESIPPGTKNTSGFTYGLLVQNSQEGEQAQVRLIVENVGVRFNNTGGKLAFDSAAPTVDPASAELASIYRVWPGHALSVTIGEDGRLGKLNGYDALFAAMSASAKNTQLFNRMRADMTADNLCEILHNVRYAPLPVRPVKVGESWRSEHKVANPLFGEIVIEHDSKLESVEMRGERRIAIVRYTSETKVAPGAKAPPNTLGAQAQLHAWKTTGSVEVDVATGEPLDLNQTSEVEYVFELPSRGDNPSASLKVESENKYRARISQAESRPQAEPRP